MTRILIIDDDATTLKVMKTLAEKNGYETLIAKNGREGLGIAFEEKPELIIVDYSMPEMDGLTFIKECKASESLQNIPVITLTANDNAEFDFMNSGAQAFVSKPFTAEDMLTKIQDTLNPKKKGLFDFFKKKP